MADLIQLRRDLAANWTVENPILAQGELGLELDTKQYKVGDGVTAWTTLAYYTGHGSVSSTEFGYLDGVTSGIQGQINSKQATVTGAATTIVSSDLTASRALVSDGSGKVAVSSTVSATELGYLDGVISPLQAQLDTKQFYHGFVNRTSSTLAFDNTSHVFTLGVTSTCQVYIGGVSYTINSPGLTIDLDSKTLSTGLWFIYLEVSNGAAVLNASKTSWSITSITEIPCSTIYWNGSAGALSEERHGFDRNLQDHLYKHKKIGSRIENDGSFAQTLPTTTTDGQMELSGGILWDEDIQNAIASPQVRCRLWYESAAGVWTWKDGTDNAGKDRPYLWNTGTTQVQYPKSDNAYTLTDSANNQYTCVWVYASNDIDRPIAIVTKSLTVGYSSAANARLETPPAPPFSPELKLLWRWIYRGDGEYQEAADYRTSASLPSGGVTAPSALSVSFAPTGDIAALNVQSAIEELDTEKQAILVSGTNIKTINSTSLLGSGDIAIAASGGSNPIFQYERFI